MAASDNITFNLANAGCSVSKYPPLGPIKDVIPYLMRRAQETVQWPAKQGLRTGAHQEKKWSEGAPANNNGTGYGTGDIHLYLPLN